MEPLVYIVYALIASFFGITIYELIKRKYDARQSYRDVSNTDKDAKRELIMEINNAKKKVLLATGNCNQQFYSDEEILKSLKDAAAREVDIKILSGTPKKIKANPIYKLANEEKNIKLYFCPKDFLQPHFRIIDNRDLFLEKPHPIDEKRRYFSFFKNNSFLVRKYNDLFYDLLSKSYVVPSEIDFK